MRPAQAVIKVGFRASSPGQGAEISSMSGFGVEPQSTTSQPIAEASEQPAGFMVSDGRSRPRIFDKLCRANARHNPLKR